ncbi:MAG: hypothetical protein AYK18_07020 [Theionarchaea archaeon DG-70]|nr:MAG: hypothetical protein AYK18_07020 [Theionarchaea archaeon DG-70]
MIDPDFIGIFAGIIAVMVLWAGPKTYIILSAKGNLIYIFLTVWLSIRFYLLREEVTFGIQNSIICGICFVVLLLLLLIPGLVTKIFKGVGI